MNINNVGYKFTHGKDFRINRPGGSGDYAILFLRTSAIFTLGGVDTEAEAGAFILYKKGTPQFFGAKEEKFINDWIHFELDEAEEQEIMDLGIPFDIPVHLGDISYFSEIIKSMHREKYSANILKETTLELYFKIMLVKLSEILNYGPSHIGNRYYKELSALRTRIYNEPEKEWNVAEMAEQAALSASYFQHLYKSFFGISCE